MTSGEAESFASSDDRIWCGNDPMRGVERRRAAVGFNYESECGGEAATLGVVARRLVAVMSVGDHKVRAVRPGKEFCTVLRCGVNAPKGEVAP